MTNRSAGSVHFRYLLAVIALGVLAIGAVLGGGPDSAAAQGVDVRISELDCEGNPEVIVVMNEGDQPVEMTGWNLQSDPTTSESLPLGSLGSLSPGESLLVESGPSAEAAFTWSRNFVFRDNDPSDFAQLASDAGDVLLKVNCGAVQQPTATPAPAAAPTVGPSPTALAAAAPAVPTSGGPPGIGGGLISPAAMIVAGTWLLTAGLGTLTYPLIRRRSRSFAAEAASVGEAIPPRGHAPAVAEAPASLERHGPPPRSASDRVDRRTGPAPAEEALPAIVLLSVFALVLMALLVFPLWSTEKKRQ